MHEAAAVAALAQAQLADGLQKGKRFDVTHRATDLHNGHIGGIGGIHARALQNERLDLVGDVRNDLHGLAEVLTPALLAQHRVVDLARGEVVVLASAGVGEALVVAEVEVRLGAVFRDKDLSVLEGAHGAWVDVEVWVHLDDGHRQASGLQQRAHGCGGDALAQ